MIRTFTTRLRATLMAVGLVVAAVAQPCRADDGPVPSPLNPPPSGGTVVIQGPSDRPLARPGTVVIQGPTTVAPPGPGVVVHDGPGAVVGEQILSGGLGYLNSGSCGPGCTSSLWYWKFDYLHLRRDIDNPRSLIATVDPITGDILTRGLPDHFDFNPAGRFTYGRALVETSACDLFLEATYLGQGTDSISFFSGPGTFFGTPLSSLFLGTVAQHVNYESRLDSIEVNLKWDYYVDNSLYLLLGLRYIRLEDEFDVTEFGTVIPPTPFVGAGGLARARQSVDVTNNLIGLQIGFEWNSRNLASRWNLETYGRAGVYANVLDGNIVQEANAESRGAFLNEINPGRLQLSGELEIGIVSTYRLAPSLNLRAGYHVMWLAAIALAPDQPVPSLEDGQFLGRLSNNQDALYHGPFVGLEYHWGCCR